MAFDVRQIQDAAFGAPVQTGDRTVIPVSRVLGGGGSFGLWPFSASGGMLRARPMGLYRVGADGEQWLPARPSRLSLGLVLGTLLALAASVAVVRRRRSVEEPVSPPAGEPG